MNAGLRFFAAFLGCLIMATPAVAQGGRKLAVGPEAGGYQCPDGRQIFVFRCNDDSLSANCQLVQMHIPPVNGFQAETIAKRSDLLATLAACTVTPVRIDGRLVSLAPPKSVAPTQKPSLPQQATKAPTAPPASKTPSTTITRDGGPPITVTDGMAIGREGVSSSLIRVSTPGSATTIHYVDEASRRQTAQKDIVVIWELLVWPDGIPGLAGVSATWVEMKVNCKEHSYETTVTVALDRQANVVSAVTANSRGTTSKDLTKDSASTIACQTAIPSKGRSYFYSAAAAMSDAIPTTAATVAAEVKACTNGSALSCTGAGHEYYNGFAGTPEDRPRAAKYYQQACDKNDGDGCFFLSLMYRDGEGIPKRPDLSKQLEDKACKLGSPMCLRQKAGVTQ